MNDSTPKEMVAEAYLTRLRERGIEYVFANAGTDFAPIVESLSRNTGSTKFPKFITVPHENVAMAMAHGYYRTSGKLAAVMVHVTVGTANSICGIMNAARDGVPVLLAAGRTPLTETGHVGSRNRSIHWGQEAFDQGGMVREFTKWDYELRSGQPVAAIVDRALDIAMSEPRGPVYLTLPREVLSDAATAPRRNEERPLGAMAAVPSQEAIDAAADLLAGAQFPLVLTSALGRSPEAFAAFAALTEEFALPVAQGEPNDLNLPSNHPMNLGFDVKALLPRADVVLVLDAPVPWVPKAVSPGRDAKIIHISPDPLQTQYPFRDFEADLLITGTTRGALPLLRESLRKRMKRDGIETRRKAIAALREELVASRRRALEAARGRTPISTSHIAACLNELKTEDAIIINELGVPISQLQLTKQGSYMGSLLAGGLGFGLGAALGAKLAAPEREVISIVGDGSYMFGNPLPFHYVGRAESLPTLTIIANNQSWHAVRASTLDVFPGGYAAKANIMPLTELKPSPDYEGVITTCGGVGEKVVEPGDLPAALKRAFDAVRAGTPALLNVIMQGRDA
ncbi:MAG TPA: thiamine pyrophosphate-requiring protein [Xanthobacteraceae bacterium]|nr:thiamine pyrophosphate-requiring protein [Xanthobacteraceae bacterium]